MNSRELTIDALIGVLIGFALSGLFYVIWGAFQLVGFFLWSIVAGRLTAPGCPGRRAVCSSPYSQM